MANIIGRTLRPAVPLVLACLLALPPGSRAAEAEKKSAGVAALTVRATELRAEQWAGSLAANGSIAAWQEAVIGSELSGVRIAEVRANVGDAVQRGEVLAELAAQTLQAAEAESRAAFMESEAQLNEAAANAERTRKLAASGFISAQQAVQASTAEQTARARVEVQRARHQADALRLEQTRILAPDAGIISASQATVGSLTQPGAELFRLIRKGRLEWRAELTADELAQVRRGMEVELVPAQGRALRGKVRAVAPAVDARTRYGQVLVELPADARLIAGQFMRGVIRLGKGGAVQSLPQTAVVLRNGAAYVYLIGQDGRAHERKVGTGARQGDRIAITSGLAQGERVVEAGGAFLTDGDLVRLVAQ